MKKVVKDFETYLKEDHMGVEIEKDGDLQDEATELDLDESLLDELVTLAGDEACVEDAAKEAYEDLKSAFESGTTEEPSGEPVAPENLAISALVMKLVEMGKIDQNQADEFLGKHID